MKSDPAHWNAIFNAKQDRQLGWYETDAAQTLEFLGYCDWDSRPTVFLPGAGTSVLVDVLLGHGARLVLNDISDKALGKLRDRLGLEISDRAFWLHHDMAVPLPEGYPAVDLWIDRAVLHFLLEEEQVTGYFNNLRKLVKPGGLALFAEFSLEGAPTCAGLPVHRYSSHELVTRLGPGFELLREQSLIYTNPFGEPRPYVYTLHRRAGSAQNAK
jgi:hypothetical protein